MVLRVEWQQPAGKTVLAFMFLNKWHDELSHGNDLNEENT